MNLSAIELGWLNDVGSGIAATEAFMARLTDYHGDAVATEYLITTDIARALLDRTQPAVAVEYLINAIENHVVIRDKAKEFKLGSRRFDVAVQNPYGPVFVVEVKIRVTSLHTEVAEDMKKIISYLDCLTPRFAKGVLGVCVFQVHLPTRVRSDVPGLTSRIHGIEAQIKAELDLFAAAKPDHEFAWAEFQAPNDRVHDDETLADEDGSPMLGRFGFACRYHGILIRRLCGRAGTGAIPTVPIY